MTNQVVIEKLNRSIDVCKLHISRLNYAIEQIETIMPLTNESFSKLSNVEIQAIDQFNK